MASPVPSPKTIYLARLLAEIEAFCAERGWSDYRFGSESCGDRHLVEQIRNGSRDLKTETLVRIRAFMANYREAA